MPDMRTFQRREIRGNKIIVNGMIGRETNIEQEVENAISGNDAHITNVDTVLSILFRKISVGCGSPEGKTTPFGQQTPYIYFSVTLDHLCRRHVGVLEHKWMDKQCNAEGTCGARYVRH
jgi:hypothetical protein